MKRLRGLRSSFVICLALIGAVLVIALLLPGAASAWFRNIANAHIARALAPTTTPSARILALNDADAQLARADAWTRDALTAYARARSLLARANAPRAVETFRATGDTLRDDFIAQFVWGFAEWDAGNAPAAFERWRAAGAFEYFLNRAQRASFKHQWADAALFARLAAEIRPEDADARYTLGDVLGYRDADAALRELERAAELTRDPELLATILSRQGEILAARGEFAAALARFEEAMRLAPRDARPRTDAARILLTTPAERDARARAVELLRESLAVAPWYVAAYITLAELAEAERDLVAAEAWYAQARSVAQARNDPALLFARAQFYARQNRWEDARADLMLAMRYETREDELRQMQRALEALNAR
jgi:tetratricopeptide (TPR) repeat protein